MATAVDVIRFQLPERSEQCLFISNLPTSLSREELWSCLHAAFSPHGLIHKIQLPKNTEHNYAFIKFYSEYACQCARQSLGKKLCIGGQSVKVVAARERLSPPTMPLHVTNCHTLANHYLGFNGWTTSVRSLEQDPSNEWCCEVVIHVKVLEVESVGRGRAAVESHDDVLGRVRAVGIAKKQALNRACEDAFSRLVFAVLQPGDRLASVILLGTQHSVTSIEHNIPQVNTLPEAGREEEQID